MAPRGALAVAHSRPPCASMILRLIANPRPSPCALVVRGELQRKADERADIIRNAHKCALEKQCAASSLRFHARHRKPNIDYRRHQDHRGFGEECARNRCRHYRWRADATLVAGYRNGQPGIALARRRRGSMLFCVLKCRFLAAQNGRGAMSDLSPKSAT